MNSPRLLFCFLLGIGWLTTWHQPGRSQQPTYLPALRPGLTFLGDSLPRQWLGTDTAYLDYGKARNDFHGVHGCVQLYFHADSVVARWYSYADTTSDAAISLPSLRAFYAARRHRWRLLRRLTAPRARVLDQLSAELAQWPAFRSVHRNTAVDTYLLTTTARPEATLVIDHSAHLNAHRRILELFRP